MANDRTHPMALSDFIIAAIEEACPEIDGQKVYMRGFSRFTQYCSDQARKTNEFPVRRTTGLPNKRQMRRTRPRG